MATALGWAPIAATDLWLLRQPLDLDLARTTVLPLIVRIERSMAASTRCRGRIQADDPSGNPSLLAASAVVLGVHLLLLMTPMSAAFHRVPSPLAMGPVVTAVVVGSVGAFERTKVRWSRA